MPTENRSSNTEMVSAPRELTQMAADAIDDLLADGVSAVSAAAWVDIPQKLRALLAQPAEQHQDEPVGYQVRTMTDRPGSQWTPWRECCDTTRAMHSHEVGRFNRFGIMREIRPVYTHADPGEVERLRAEVKRLELTGSQSDYSYDMDQDHMRGRIDLLEDLVGKFVRNCEKHKLHLSDIPALSGYRWYLKRFEAALSASAEQEAPRSEPEKPSRCTSCDNCQGFNIGHDSSQQKPHSIRCDNCHKEARAADHDGLATAWNALNQSE